MRGREVREAAERLLERVSRGDEDGALIELIDEDPPVALTARPISQEELLERARGPYLRLGLEIPHWLRDDE
jgi:hypothetical protein